MQWLQFIISIEYFKIQNKKRETARSDTITSEEKEYRAHNPQQNSRIWIDEFEMSMQNRTHVVIREGIGSTVKSLDCEFDEVTHTRPAAKTYQATFPKNFQTIMIHK